MAEWTDVKTEDTPTFHQSAMDGTEPGVYLTPTEPHIDSAEQSVSLPETEPVYPGRPPTATPSERQRTVQACDKCRERKTKYSTREPRTRGPSKARLRNAVSTTDLRTSPKPRTYSHGAHHFEPLHHLRQHYPRDILTNQQSLRRVASIPRSFHGSDHNVQMSTHGFEPVSETFMQPFGFDENSYDSPTFPARQSQYVAHNPRAPQWRDVRRVQSYSTLIGSSEGNLNRYASPHPLASLGAPESYCQWTSQERVSPPPMPMYNTYDQFMPPAAPLEPQVPRLLSPKVHPWGYHSDGGSTG
ncbi:hypothetical protein DXG03_000843 [Asterophora parasitica]|uniref:Uncharacterized protein n=1 Tax=Asterophora parasitica TaxID=117018 RepID=A0A9P7GHA4_9AGAR|nr:hypothetical protein DXG03_000843 [Asterophora parasitica]